MFPPQTVRDEALTQLGLPRCTQRFVPFDAAGSPTAGSAGSRLCPATGSRSPGSVHSPPGAAAPVASPRRAAGARGEAARLSCTVQNVLCLQGMAGTQPSLCPPPLLRPSPLCPVGTGHRCPPHHPQPPAAHLGPPRSRRQGCHFQARPSQAAVFSFRALGAGREIS